MVAFLKLIRWPNLLIVAFTQCMVRYCMLGPLLLSKGLNLQMHEIDFFLIVLSTILIAAGGYIINDYFDVRIDSINQTHENVIDKGIKRRSAIILHWIVSISGVIIGTALGIRYGMWKLGLIYFICATGLWFYSTTFKRKLIIGNVTIAIFTALVPIIPAMYELRLEYLNIKTENPFIFFYPLWKWTIGLSIFAFLTTLIREIVKDIEDIEGDKTFGCKTLPIVWGIPQAKALATVYGIFTSIGLAYIQILQFKSEDYYSLGYFLMLIQAPLIYCIYKLISASKTSDYSQVSKFLKIIMFVGISYLFLFTYLMHYGLAVYH